MKINTFRRNFVNFRRTSYLKMTGCVPSYCTRASREPQWRVPLGRTDPPRYSSCVFIVTFGFRGRSSWVRHRGPGGGRHLRRPSRRQGGRRWGRRLVWADGAAACVCLGRFLPPLRVEGRITVLLCWKAARERHGGVLSCAASWQLGRLLHAPGRGLALRRRPRFVLLRVTGNFLTGLEGQPACSYSSAAGAPSGGRCCRSEISLSRVISASWRSLAVVVRPHGGGQGCAALCGRL